MSEEAAICRVCRSEGTAEEPLFHPCLCSGSIRYIHQTCLVEWLNHSQKSYCELCNHPFTFSPIYSNDMPKDLPFQVFVAGMLNRFAVLVRESVRNLLVLLIWGVATPFITNQIYRFYFPHEPLLVDLSYFDSLVDHDSIWLKQVLYEIFMGLVVCLLICVGFLSLFILRDFIMTNAVLNEVDVDMEQVQQEDEGHFEQIDAETQYNEDEEVAAEELNLRDSFERYVPRTRRRTNESQRSNAEDFGYTLPDVDSSEFISNLQLNEDFSLIDERGKQVAPEYREEPEAGTSDDIPRLPLFNLSQSEESAERARANFISTNQDFQQFLDRQRQDQQILNELRADMIERNNNVNNIAVEMAAQQEPPQEITLVEMLGMKGPIYVLFQNFLLVLFVNSIVLGTFVYIPYLTGSLIFSTGLGLDKIYTLVLQPWIPLVNAVLKISLGETTYDKLGSQLHQIMDLLKDHDITEYKATCISVGYVFLCSCIYLYVKVVEAVQGDKISRMAKSVVQVSSFALTFFKIMLLLVIELIAFPIFCGVLINICTLRVLNASLIDRMEFIVQYTALSTLLHWVIGSMFMFQFAQFISTCRDILRPGLLYFIRNPNDPNYHPMKEMVEKPLMYQIKRIFASAAIYSFILFMIFGVSLKLAQIAVPSLFPLDLSLSSTTSVMEIFLLNTFIPFMLKKVNIGQKIRVGMAFYLSYVCKFLGISSYYFGGRYNGEENKGKFVFVPSFDHVYKQDERITMMRAEVNPEDLERYGMVTSDHEKPMTELRKTAVNQFNPPDLYPLDLKDFHSHNHRYTIVYRPTYFPLRNILFLASMWVTVSLMSYFVLLTPFLIGRAIFKQLGVTYSDVYSFQVGFHVFWITITMLYGVLQAIKKLRMFTIDQIIEKALKLSVNVVKLSFCVFCIGFLIPFLTGFWIDLVFIYPLKVYPDETMIFQFVHEWCFGLLVVRLAHVLLTRFGANTQLKLALDKIKEDGVANINLPFVGNRVLLPIAGFFAVALVSPLVLNQIIQRAFGVDSLYKELNLLVALAIPMYFALNQAFLGFEQLMSKIRDDAYLVGQELHNFERP